VLMMENHSYDNYLGMLADRGEGLPPGPDGTPDAVNYTPNGRGYPAHHMARTTQVKNNPSQNWRSSHIQFAGGRNDGFAAAIAEALPGADPAVAMGYWTEDDLPFYYGLARTFPLADRWFSSCLGPTFPNRRFLISGTAHGLMDDLPWDIVDYPEAGTIFDVLTGHGIDWVNYHNVRHNPLLRRVLGGRGLTAIPPARIAADCSIGDTALAVPPHNAIATIPIRAVAVGGSRCNANPVSTTNVIHSAIMQLMVAVLGRWSIGRATSGIANRPAIP